nr:T9SS type A sorting domain-containing protein [Bacteroidota bacterium]
MYDNNNIQGYTIINDGANLIIETNTKQLIQARIFNLAGQVVKQQFFNNSTLKYIVQLPPASGIYLLELVDSDGGVVQYRGLSK